MYTDDPRKIDAHTVNIERLAHANSYVCQVSKKVSQFSFCSRDSKTNNFLVDDLLEPNDEPRTRGRKGSAGGSIAFGTVDLGACRRISVRFGVAPRNPRGTQRPSPRRRSWRSPPRRCRRRRRRRRSPSRTSTWSTTDDEPAPKTVAKRKTVVDDVREPRSVPQTSRTTSNVFVVYFSPIAPTHVPSPTALTRPSPHTG